MKIIKDKEIPAIQSTCGSLKEIFSDKVGIAKVEMVKGKTVPHYHKQTTEYYIVLKGKGVLAVKQNTVIKAKIDLLPGIFVRIDPYDIHQTKSNKGLVVLTVTTPAWSAEDEIETDNIFE